jgi:hypothetical protein
MGHQECPDNPVCPSRLHRLRFARYLHCPTIKWGRVYRVPEYPGQTENIYQITRPGVTLKPYGATHSNPYPAIFEFGLQATADDIVFEYLYCRNPTTIPLAEPTLAGSPYPGFPAAAPAGWAYWGSGGTISISPLGQVDGITIRNCVMNGGAGGISSFNCTSLTLDGNIIFDVGWEAVDRHHGHCHYMRNGGQTNTPCRSLLFDQVPHLQLQPADHYRIGKFNTVLTE